MNILEPGKRSIKYWSADDRPREKLVQKGRQVLSDAELLAILIGTGTRKHSAIDLARGILGTVKNDLNELARLGIKELMQMDGIGEAKAVSIISAIELGGRRQSAEVQQKQMISGSKDVHLYFAPRIGDLSHEEMWMLTLTRANTIMSARIISEGGVSGTVADPKKIFKTAIDQQASGIILAHNHPSGNLKPSAADRELTNKLNEGARILEISLLDHVIITQAGYYSFADEGLL